MLNFCNVDNIYEEKYVENMLNIYFPFLYKGKFPYNRNIYNIYNIYNVVFEFLLYLDKFFTFAVRIWQ